MTGATLDKRRDNPRRKGALAKLLTHQADIMELKHQGLSDEAAGKALGLSQPAATILKNRALANIRKLTDEQTISFRNAKLAQFGADRQRLELKLEPIVAMMDERAKDYAASRHPASQDQYLKAYYAYLQMEDRLWRISVEECKLLGITKDDSKRENTTGMLVAFSQHAERILGELPSKLEALGAEVQPIMQLIAMELHTMLKDISEAAVK